jgi:uncharacterized membrane protein (UPF0127 family)
VQARDVDAGAVLASDLEVARGFRGRFMGLMGRASLAPGRGLWLPGDNGIHMFFMRFPIDAAFLGRPDADGLRTVVAVHADLPPWTGIVPFVAGAHGVLELPAGTLAAAGVRAGDRVAIG